jgi:hypothetical protein
MADPPRFEAVSSSSEQFAIHPVDIVGSDAGVGPPATMSSPELGRDETLLRLKKEAIQKLLQEARSHLPAVSEKGTP